jgi:thiol-disulfide isomerase/thioredoxin
LAVALVLIGGAIVALEPSLITGGAHIPKPPANLPASEEGYTAAPDFSGAVAWINSNPVNLADLQGKVVLVDFWTYSCINCIHTFPHVEEDYLKYQAYGFTVIGVHTPEFAFERVPANIEAAAHRYNLTYPIAIDSNYKIWEDYNNQYWPAEYLIDQYGRIRHTQFGEGGYVETETFIRALLNESGHPVPDSVPFGIDNTAQSMPDQTGELYAAAAEGADRVALCTATSAGDAIPCGVDSHGSAVAYEQGATVEYTPPATLQPGRIYPVGPWLDGPQSLTALDNTSVDVNFTAAAGNVVMNGTAGSCVSVLLDGKPIPMPLAGQDVMRTGGVDGGIPCIRIDGPRSYDFFSGPMGSHTLQLGVPRGFSLFTFDFTGPPP